MTTNTPTARKRASGPAPKPATPAPATAPTPAPTPKWQSPTLGLAKAGATAPTPADVKLGAWAGTETEGGYATDAQGRMDGSTTSETTSTAGAGAKRSSESESSTFDGTTKVASTNEKEVLAGAEASITKIVKSGPQMVDLAVEGCARAGAFGSAAQSNAISRGPFAASWEGALSGGAGVQADMAASAHAKMKGIIPDLEAAFTAGIKLGLWGEASVEARAKAGPLVAAFAAKVDALVGLEAQLEASAFANLRQGLGAQFEASAFGGARFKGSASAEFGMDVASVELGAEVDMMAGAEASASGRFSIGPKGLAAAFEASAFAGAKLKATGSATIKLRGKSVVSASGTVSISAGAGVEAVGVIEMTSKRFRLKFGADATLGTGLGFIGDLDIDMEALSTVILAEIKEMQRSGPTLALTSPDFDRNALPDTPEFAATKAEKKKVGYDAVHESFLAYNNKKVMGGENGIKREQVQAIITNVVPLIRADLMGYTEVDEGIAAAATDAFQGQLDAIMVQAGVIRQWKASAGGEANRLEKRGDETMRVARDALRTDLAAYATKKSEKGKNGVKQDKIAAIVAKHAKPLAAAFGPESDAVVNFVGNEVLADYGTLVWAGGRGTFTPKAGGAAAVKKGVADQKLAAAAVTAVGGLRNQLATYRSQVVGNPKAQVDVAKISTMVRKAIGGLAPGPDLDQAVVSAVTTSLGGLVTNVSVNASALTLSADSAGLASARAAKATEDSSSARATGLATFKQSLATYKEKKTDQGASGLNQPRIAEALRKAGIAPPTDALERAVLDQDIVTAAQEALGDAFGAMVVTDGAVVSFTEAAGVMTAAKGVRARDGKAVLTGGAEDDNQRHQLVSDLLRRGLGSYAGKVHAKQVKDPTSRDAQISREELQGIVTKGLSKVLADVRNAAGDSAVKSAILQYFPEIDEKTLTVTDLAISGTLTRDLGAKAKAAASKAAWPLMQQAQRGIVADLEPLTAQQLSTPLVQAVVNNHIRGLRSIPVEDLDAVVISAVTAGLGTKLAEVDSVDGKITKLEIITTRARSGAVTSR